MIFLSSRTISIGPEMAKMRCAKKREKKIFFSPTCTDMTNNFGLHFSYLAAEI